MPKTPLMLEVQLTQEYLGFATHLVYLAPLYKECLDADTYAKGQGSTVAKVLEGRLDAHQQSGIAGVANIGNDLNWCGHPFAQANWYAFGRLAWNPEADTKAIAQDWVRQTFTNDEKSANVLVTMMMASREITVDYMTPLGLHHIMGWSHHYGPGPWIANKPRVDWTSVYYHKADSLGLGFDRTREGSGAVAQYFPPVEAQFASLDSCPENLLLWFHHVSWDYKMRSGKTLWNELCAHYYAGVDSVKWMQNSWQQVRGQIDESRFREVEMLLQMQYDEAVVWRNSCVLYFQSFSKRAIPAGLPKPDHDLQYYINKKYSFVPGN
jgi:alpha-glucuronidase